MTECFSKVPGSIEASMDPRLSDRESSIEIAVFGTNASGPLRQYLRKPLPLVT